MSVARKIVFTIGAGIGIGTWAGCVFLLTQGIPIAQLMAPMLVAAFGFLLAAMWASDEPDEGVFS